MKERIQALIAENQTEEAINELLKIAKGKHRDKLLVLKASFEKIKNDEILDLTSSGELVRSQNKLNYSLLELASKILDSSPSGEQPPLVTTTEEDRQKRTRSWKEWLAIVGGILAMLAGIAEFSGYSLRDLFSGPSISSNTVHITVKSQNPNITLPKSGKVFLTYGAAQVGKDISNNLEAIFTEVPEGYFDKENKVKITFKDPLGEPYYAIHEDSLYQLEPNQSIEVLVGLRGLDKLYGIVKDFKTGDYIEGARVSVLNLEAFTDKNGWWELPIEEEGKQLKFHTVRVSKEGYHNKEISNIPAQIEKEIAVLLQPK